VYFLIRNWSHIATHLVLLLVLVGAASLKCLWLRCFESDRVEIWQDCSSSKYTSIDGVGILTRRHNSNMVTMTSFPAERCYRLVSAHAASARGTYAAASASSWSIVHSCLLYIAFLLYTVHRSQHTTARHGLDVAHRYEDYDYGGCSISLCDTLGKTLVCCLS